MPWLLLLLGCWEPTSTNARGMVGTLVGPDGIPIDGQVVESLEGRAVTDALGTFKVAWKEPSTYIHFQREGLWFKRFWQPDQDTSLVTVALPELVQTRVWCEHVEVCKTELTWKRDDGLIVTARPTCDPDDHRPEPMWIPAGLGAPSGVCKGETSKERSPMATRLQGDQLRLTPPLVPLRIELSASAATQPRRCEVFADGLPATTVADGAYTIDVFGKIVISVTCDGIAAKPHAIIVRKPATWQAHWTRDTPEVDLQAAVPWATSLRMHAREGIGSGWFHSMEVGPNGTVKLPPLTPGLYVVGIGVSDEEIVAVRPVDDLEPQVLHLVRRPAEEGDEPSYIGILPVAVDSLEGQVPVNLTIVP